jgi:D-glycero-D-manno-heptose 1,7-bisphosphate phosphatase
VNERSAAPVVILDRDGTVVIDREYLADPAGLEFEAGAAEALRLLQGRGFRLVVVTNQSGVGRGFFSLREVEAMNRRLLDMAASIGVRLAAIYYCPHAPEAGCDCRKPGQALMNQAAADLGFDPAASFVVGDRDSDVEFGRRAGARTVLIAKEAPSPPPPDSPGHAPGPASSAADFVARDLLEAARFIVDAKADIPD